MPHLHHPDSTLLDRLLGIGSTITPQVPDPEVVRRVQENKMPIQDHRRLWLHTQPVGPVQLIIAAFAALLFFAAL